MSTGTPNTAGQQTKDSAASDIEAFFNSVEARAQQGPRLHHETGTCQFNITGVGSWLFSIKDGVPTLIHDATNAPKPDVTFTCPPEVFLRIVHREGKLNANTAMLQGLLVVTGDPYLATAVLFGN